MGKVRACKKCGSTELQLSKRSLCFYCGQENTAEACRQMMAQSGPIYEKQQLRYSQAMVHIKSFRERVKQQQA